MVIEIENVDNHQENIYVFFWYNLCICFRLEGMLKDFYHFSLSPKAFAYHLAHIVWANCSEEAYILSLATFTPRLYDHP